MKLLLCFLLYCLALALSCVKAFNDFSVAKRDITFNFQNRYVVITVYPAEKRGYIVRGVLKCPYRFITLEKLFKIVRQGRYILQIPQTINGMGDKDVEKEFKLLFKSKRFDYYFKPKSGVILLKNYNVEISHYKWLKYQNDYTLTEEQRKVLELFKTNKIKYYI